MKKNDEDWVKKCVEMLLLFAFQSGSSQSSTPASR